MIKYPAEIAVVTSLFTSLLLSIWELINYSFSNGGVLQIHHFVTLPLYVYRGVVPYAGRSSSPLVCVCVCMCLYVSY